MSYFAGARLFQDEMIDFSWDKERAALWAGMGAGKTVTAATFVGQAVASGVAPRWLIVGPRLVAETVWHTEIQKWPHLRHLEARRLVSSDFELEPSIFVERDGQTVEIAYSDRRPGDEVEYRRRDGSAILTPVQVTLDREHVLYDPQGTIGRRGGLVMPERRAVKKRLQSYEEPVHIISYDFLPWLVRAYGANWPYDGIILDESTFVQNRDSLRFGLLNNLINVKGRVRFVLELSGLPAPNGHEGLWAQFKLLDGGDTLGGTITDFRNEWCVPDGKNAERVFSWKIRKKLEDAFTATLGARALSATVDLGIPLVEVDVKVELNAEARRLYNELETQLATVLRSGEAVAVANGGVLRQKLMQVCNGAIYDASHKAHRLDGSKIDVLLETAESLTRGVILAYKYQYDLPYLKKALGRHVMSIKEAGALEAFRRGKVKFLATQPGSMAHGVDGLQDVGHNTIWFGVPDSLEHYAQLNKRMHRFGQSEGTVFVHRIYAADTVEEDVKDFALPGKMAINDAVSRGVLARALRRG